MGRPVGASRPAGDAGEGRPSKLAGVTGRISALVAGGALRVGTSKPMLEGQLRPGGSEDERVRGHEHRPGARDAVALREQLRHRGGIRQAA